MTQDKFEEQIENLVELHYHLKNKSTMMNRHNLSMLVGLAAVFITAVIPLTHGGHMTAGEIFTAIITGLVAAEHSFAGKTE